MNLPWSCWTNVQKINKNYNEKKDFRLKPLWSHEMGATECVIAPQRPPVNTHADKQVLVVFH